MVKVQFIGASRRTGKAKDTGNPYDICMFSYLVPMEPKKTEQMQFLCHGSQAKEVEMSPDVLNQCAGIEAGAWVNVELSPNPMNMQKNIITKVSKV